MKTLEPGCKHYDQGNCAKQRRTEEVTRLMLWHVVRVDQPVETPCSYDDRVWAGTRAYLGAVGSIPKQHADCPLFEPDLGHTFPDLIQPTPTDQ